MISDDISERGLIFVEILSITTLLVFVEKKINNEIHVMTGCTAIDTLMGCLSALFTHHVGIDHFEVIETLIFKFLHEKINLGGEDILLFKLVNLLGERLSAFINPTLTRSHLFNQSLSFINTKSKE
jgi:hypothetical protein